MLAGDAVAGVFSREDYDRLQPDENLKTLNFEDDSIPLWERVGRARLAGLAVALVGLVLIGAR